MFDDFPEDERPFLDAIAENPFDLGVRRVYADWLDDRGDPRGEFLRLECELEEARCRIEECRPHLGRMISVVDRNWAALVRLKYDLILQSCSQRIEAMRLIRFRWDLGLAEAKELLDSVPVVLARNIPYEAAEGIVDSFCGIADVHLVPSEYTP